MEATAALSELERVQIQILRRISDLELRVGLTHSPSPVTTADNDAPAEANLSGHTTEARLSNILLENGVKDFKFKRVSFDYYDWTLDSRRDALGAASIHHLCKSIVMVNTQAPSSITDCSNRDMSKYYVVVVQYTARFNAETVKNFLYTLNNGKIPKKKFNLRLAPEETSQMLTGYEHNGVTCIGMKTDIPVILDEAIVKLNPDFFWLGGGEIDLKLGIRTSEFINYLNPFIVSCSSS
ncbi:hypothetical protein ACET3Z_029009 [Daucus carota]